MKMIPDDIVIKLKGSSKKERELVRKILLDNYNQLLDAIEKEADYCTVDAYWKDYTPMGDKPIIEAKKFIADYGKKQLKKPKVR